VTEHRIKVLHLITSLDTGGAEAMLTRLATAMDRRRFENVVVSLTTTGPLAARISAEGIRVAAVGMSRSMPTPTALWRLYRLLRAERPDVLQTWLYHSDFCGLLAGRAARVPAIAWNIRCAQTDDRYTRGVNGVLVRILARLSLYPDAVAVNSQAGRDVHTALGYRPKHWVVLENGFNLTRFHPDPAARHALRQEIHAAESDRIIGLVARHDPLKDHDTFLRAAALLGKTSPGVHFVLVGSGVDASNQVLTATIDKLGIADKIHMLGARDDVPFLTAGFDIATCCSLGEGFPNVVGEAMACGVPCVVTDVGDAALIVGDSGLVVKPGDPKALSDGWQQLIAKDADSLGNLGRRALERVEANYSMNRCIERYQTFYSELANSSSS
jgi:glycosyltransferase involved in cell wall biosynthesis